MSVFSDMAKEHLEFLEKEQRHMAWQLEAKRPFKMKAVEIQQQKVLPTLESILKELAGAAYCGVSLVPQGEDAPFVVLQITPKSTFPEPLKSTAVFRFEYDEWLVCDTAIASVQYPRSDGFKNSSRHSLSSVTAGLIEQLAADFIKEVFQNARN